MAKKQNSPRKSKKASAPKPTRPIQDLREWLERVDEMGELVRVQKPVDRDE